MSDEIKMWRDAPSTYAAGFEATMGHVPKFAQMQRNLRAHALGFCCDEIHHVPNNLQL